MTKIFISWSKAKSRDLAFELKSLLEKMAPDINVFLSEDSIAAGEHVQEKIINQLYIAISSFFASQRKIRNPPGFFMKLDLHAALTKQSSRFFLIMIPIGIRGLITL